MPRQSGGGWFLKYESSKASTRLLLSLPKPMLDDAHAVAKVQGISVERVYAYADRLLGNAGGCDIYPPGLGRANGWVHVDVRKAKSRWKG